MSIRFHNTHPQTDDHSNKYLFIDGGCFRSLFTNYSRIFPISIDQLGFDNVIKGFDRVFYYDAPPPQKHNENDDVYQKRLDEFDGFLDQIGSYAGVHIYEGEIRPNRGRRGAEQKTVDVKIAVDILTFSTQHSLTSCSLLTGDLDFKPLIDAVVQNGTEVELWYPRQNTNRNLILSADKKRPITIRVVGQWRKYGMSVEYPLPGYSEDEEFARGLEETDKIDEWKTSSNTTASVYHFKKKNVFLVKFPHKHFKRNKHFVYYPDLEILESYIRDSFEEFWKSPIM